MTGGIDFDPLKYVKETASRVVNACEMNFDPLARQSIENQNRIKLHFSNKLKMDQTSF